MKLGQTPDLVQNADMSKFSDRVDIKEGINTHRVLTGPFLTRSVYWPTMAEEGGQMVQRMRSVLIPKTGSELLRSLSDAEKEFRRTMGENDPRSQFTPSNAYLYLVFNRDEAVAEGDLPQVRVAAYKQTIFNRLKEIQEERSTKDSNNLKNGLIFMYDVQIKKTIGDKSRARFTTKYTVDVDSENNKFQGNIPAKMLEMSWDQVVKVLDENKLWGEIFTPEELQAIEDCEIDLAAETKPNTEEEILAKLKDNPVFLGAKDPNSGQFMFPQNEQFMTFLKSKEVPILESAAQSQLPPKSESPIQIEEKPQETKPESQEIKVDTAQEVQTENGRPIKRWTE